MATTAKKTTKKKTTKKATKKSTRKPARRVASKETETVDLKTKTKEERAKILATFVNEKATELEKIIHEAASKVGLEVELKLFLDIKNFSKKS